MRKINLIQAAALLCLTPVFLKAADKFKLGDFPTDTERKEDQQKGKPNSSTESDFPMKKRKPSKPKSPPPKVIKKTHFEPGAVSSPSKEEPKPSVKKSPEKKDSVSPTTPEEAKKKSNELYMQALSASQNGNFDEASKFCDEALRLDPDNLQAERMSERLESRRRAP